MEWDDDRREFVRRDRGWDRYPDPREDEDRRRSWEASDRDRGFGRDEGRDPGVRDRMRPWGARDRDRVDPDDDRERGVFTSRVSYEDWRRSADRGDGPRGRGEDWREPRDRGNWHAEPTRDPEAARRWAVRGDRDRDEEPTRWNPRSAGWSEGHRGDAPAYGTRYDLSEVPRWNGRDFAPRHDEYRTDWRGDRPRTRDDSDDRGFFTKMKDKLTGRPPRNYRRSDDRIREDVCDRLMQSWIDAEDVDVQVRDGEVSLTGTVRRRDEKRALEDLAEGVLGVRDVNNHVKVRREDVLHVAESPAASGASTAMATGAGTGINAGMGFGQGLTPGTQAGTTGRTGAAGTGPGGGLPARDVRSDSNRDDGGIARTPEGTSTAPPNGTTRRS